MGEFNGKLTLEVRDASVAQVIKILKGKLNRVASVSVKECIDFARENEGKVMGAYLEAVKARKVNVSVEEMRDGYETILRTLEKKQMRQDYDFKRRERYRETR